MKNPSPQKFFLLSFSITIFIFILSIILILNSDPSSFKNSLGKFLKDFFIANYNSSPPSHLLGKSVLLYLYLIIFLVTALLKLGFKIKGEEVPLSKIIFNVTLSGLLFVTTLQTIGIQSYEMRILNPLGNKSIEEKYRVLMKGLYQSAKEIRTQLNSSPYQCQFLTDMDLSKDPGMYYQRFLAYTLYPIDIREIRKSEPQNCLIIFEKENARNFIPPDYRVLEEFDDANIVAIKTTEPIGL
ncbi:MAG: hypothetical protein NUV91_04040 [Candidatus Omnitrophica bacterium]|nr:hypothetical protein [Candidatus Omnitrophota bacterium]